MAKTATIQAQQKWEYMEMTRKSETYLVAELNDIGKEGWDLVSVIYGKDRKGELAWTAFLKRPFVPGTHAAEHHGAQAEPTSVLEKSATYVPQTEADDGEEIRFKDE